MAEKRKKSLTDSAPLHICPFTDADLTVSTASRASVADKNGQPDSRDQKSGPDGCPPILFGGSLTLLV
jgi:hypothetical protein